MQQSFFLFNEPCFVKNNSRVLSGGLYGTNRGVCIAFQNIKSVFCGCVFLCAGCVKKHMACLKKYKPYILKYKAHILK